MILTNATLVTMKDSELGSIKDAALVVSEGKIAWIGPMQLLPVQYKDNKSDQINLNGRCVTPGLIDCHTHVIYGGDRMSEFVQRIKGAEYQEIVKHGGGIFSTVEATRRLSEEALYHQSLPRVLNMIRNGVTTLEIKSGYGLDFETERKMLRVAKRFGSELPITVHTTYLGAHVLAKEFSTPQLYLDTIIESILPKLVEEKLVDAVDAFCDEVAFTAEDLDRLFETATSMGLDIKIHAEQLSYQGGAFLAAKYNALSADHLEYITVHDIERLKDAGVVAVMLPGAYYFLSGKRRPPIQLLREHQVPMAVATDCNPGSSPVVSILSAMNMACILFGMLPQEVLLGVTKYAAKALGVLETKGTLENGKQADFVIWDEKDPLHLTYQIGGHVPYAVYQKGQMVKLDGF